MNQPVPGLLRHATRYTLVFSSSEWIFRDDRLVAVGADGHEDHLDPAEVLDGVHVAPRVARKILEPLGGVDVFRPAVEFHVNGLAALEYLQIGRDRLRELLAFFRAVSHADLQLVDAR